VGIEEQLRQRQWPQAPAHRRDVDTGDYERYMVSYGRVETRALNLHQELSEEIPAGESAITSLSRARGGRIVWGATSGRHSHLFSYDPAPGRNSVIDHGVIDGATAVRRCLAACDTYCVLGAVSATAEEDGTGRLFVYPPRSERGQRGKRARAHRRLQPHVNPDGAHPARVEFLAAPVQGECVAALAWDGFRGQAYGLTSVTGTFFVYDMSTNQISLKGAVADDRRFSSLLVADREGKVYGAGSCGRLFRYDPEKDTLTHLGLPVASIKGRQFYNQWDSAALDPATGLIYGGGSADGVLFVFDPREMTVKSLGKISAEARVRAMAMGLDGRLYGIAGEEEGMGHLFYYDTESHELADLGILFSAEQRMWHGYEFDAAVTGEWGEIYFGESDRISHLFIYQPPLRPRPATAS